MNAALNLPRTACALIETIEFEPPGGVFGLIATEGRITQELEAAFAVRNRKLRELFSACTP